MVNFSESHPLSVFLRDHQAAIDRLRQTGKPEVLKTESGDRVVIQDADAYERMFALIDQLDAEHTLRQRIDALHAGEPGVSADVVLAEIRERLDASAKGA